MVVPIVIGCVGMVCMLMFYMYDRCVFDENACRVLVWKSYVEGINNMDPAEAELENKHIVKSINYLLISNIFEQFRRIQR